MKKFIKKKKKHLYIFFDDYAAYCNAHTNIQKKKKRAYMILYLGECDNTQPKQENIINIIITYFKNFAMYLFLFLSCHGELHIFFFLALCFEIEENSILPNLKLNSRTLSLLYSLNKRCPFTSLNFYYTPPPSPHKQTHESLFSHLQLAILLRYL
jgi:hypothetical protein